MKLIIRQYLASLRERGELDAILPDLLSQLGLNVFSRPGRGTRQDGVDVGAVGSLDGGPEKVYLFSIKPGDLTRKDWDGNTVQSLRPSLNEIIDAYIPNRLPAEHQGKEIVICICIGGDVQEQVRPQLAGFIKSASGKTKVEEWNGDKLADLVQSRFLREDLLPEHARSSLRKSLALLDEPEASYQHFAVLIRSLASVDDADDAKRIMTLRQMSICLWILFAWAREAENMEAAYRSGELVLLHGWRIASPYAAAEGKAARSVHTAFLSIATAYEQICGSFLSANVLPHVAKCHALSSAVRGSCSLDINLKLFDLLGRLAVGGIWAYWRASLCSDDDAEGRSEMLQVVQVFMSAVKALITNNPTLFLPAKDDHAIDICMAAMLLALDPANHTDVRNWLAEVLNRATFAYTVHGQYPCILQAYGDLLSHPKHGDDEYRKHVTSGSVLYPTIALWAAILDDTEMYDKVARLKQEHLQHCTLQFWYPDDQSEAHLYTNSDLHGAVLSDVCVTRPMGEFLAQVLGECERTPHFRELSATKSGWWPLVVVACRHYRLPLPPHLLQGLKGTHGTSKAV